MRLPRPDKSGLAMTLPLCHCDDLLPLSLRGTLSSCHCEGFSPLCHCEERDSSLTLGTSSAISVVTGDKGRGLPRCPFAVLRALAHRNDTPFCHCKDVMRGFCPPGLGSRVSLVWWGMARPVQCKGRHDPKGSHYISVWIW
jgi:hypothetical protein